MKWFKHYSMAHNNNKLTKVRMRFGAEGYAIYWYCLELIVSDLGTQPEVTFELSHDSEVIGHNLRIDTLRVEEIMTYMISIGLFESEESTGRITCLKIAKYLDKKTTRNSTVHRIIDAANHKQNKIMSATVPDKLRQSETVTQLSELDTDTDTELDCTSTTVDNFYEYKGFYWNQSLFTQQDTHKALKSIKKHSISHYLAQRVIDEAVGKTISKNSTVRSPIALLLKLLELAKVDQCKFTHFSVSIADSRHQTLKNKDSIQSQVLDVSKKITIC